MEPELPPQTQHCHDWEVVRVKSVLFPLAVPVRLDDYPLNFESVPRTTPA